MKGIIAIFATFGAWRRRRFGPQCCSAVGAPIQASA
jgi:hypothetical protein